MKFWYLGLLMLIFIGMFGVLPLASAQTALELDQNQLGELTPTQPSLTYTVTAQDTTPLEITITSLTSEFAPLVILYDESARVLQRLPNALASPRVSLTWTPAAGEGYQIQVLGVDGQAGQFVLTLTTNTLAPLPANELRGGMVIEDRVTPSEPVQRYQLKAEPRSVLWVQVTSLLPEGGIGVVLSDENGQPVGVLRHGLGGGSFLIPATVGTVYEVWIVQSGADRDEGFVITVTGTAPALAAATPALSTPASTTPPLTTPLTTPQPTTTTTTQVIIPFDGPCAVTSRDNVGVNIRRGPSVAHDVVGGLAADQLLNVTGRDAATQWWQVEYNEGLYGWVADAAVRRGGNCTSIGLADFPPAPAGVPTEIIPSPTATINP